MGVGLLWFRLLRVFLIIESFGAFVLMIFTMLVKDVGKFFIILLIVLASFSAAVVKLYEAPAWYGAHQHYSDHYLGWVEQDSCTLLPLSSPGGAHVQHVMCRRHATRARRECAVCSRGADSS